MTALIQLLIQKVAISDHYQSRSHGIRFVTKIQIQFFSSKNYLGFGSEKVIGFKLKACLSNQMYQTIQT